MTVLGRRSAFSRTAGSTERVRDIAELLLHSYFDRQESYAPKSVGTVKQSLKRKMTTRFVRRPALRVAREVGSHLVHSRSRLPFK